MWSFLLCCLFVSFFFFLGRGRRCAPIPWPCVSKGAAKVRDVDPHSPLLPGVERVYVLPLHRPNLQICEDVADCMVKLLESPDASGETRRALRNVFGILLLFMCRRS